MSWTIRAISAIRQFRRDIFYGGVAPILIIWLAPITITALAIFAINSAGCSRLHAQKQPYRMNNEDHEHWFRIEYQKKLMTQPLDDEEKQLLGSNCAKAGFVLGFNCDVHQDGTITEAVKSPPK